MERPESNGLSRLGRPVGGSTQIRYGDKFELRWACKTLHRLHRSRDASHRAPDRSPIDCDKTTIKTHFMLKLAGFGTGSWQRKGRVESTVWKAMKNKWKAADSMCERRLSSTTEPIQANRLVQGARKKRLHSEGVAWGSSLCFVTRVLLQACKTIFGFLCSYSLASGSRQTAAPGSALGL